MFPSRIDAVDGIIPDIGIEVELVLVSDRIGLEEPANVRRVDTGLVVIETQLLEPDLPRVLEPAFIGS